MDVRLPDGRILKGVPEGTTKAQLAEKLKRNGFEVPDDWLKPAAPVEDPASFGGAGGFNPMLSRLGGGAMAAGEALGMTPENTANPVANAFGPAETALQLATGSAATPIAGLAGMGQGVWNSLAPESLQGPSAADRVRQMQSMLTYQPRTGAGAAASRVVSAPGEAFSAGTNRVGEMTADVTGSPLIGSIIKTAGDVLPGVAGARLAGARMPAEKPAGNYTSTKLDVPTTEQLKGAANANYTAAENAGVVIRPESTQRVVDMMQRVADKENLGKLPAKLKEASTVLQERIAEGKPLSLMDADKVRQLIGDAMKSTDATDRRLAKIIQGEYDGYLKSLGKGDTLSGDAAAANAMLDQARGLYRRGKNSELVDSLERKAKKTAETNFSQAGLEHALRTEFKNLSNNEKKTRGMSPEQIAAIEKVAAPGWLANTARYVGKFDPTSGPIAAAISIGSGLTVPLAGFFGRRISNKITTGNVANARAALVGRGMPPPPPRTAPKGLLAQAPQAEGLPFTPSPGVIPARAGLLAGGLELEPPPMLNPQQLPPPMQGGIPYRPAPDVSRAGNLHLEGNAPNYAGGLDFTPSNLTGNYAAQMAGLLDRTPATAAKGSKGLLDLPEKRPKKDILNDILRLERKAKTLSPDELANSAYTSGLSQELERLRAELKAHDTRAEQTSPRGDARGR